MKSFLISLIFLTALSVVLCAVDYCEIEKRLCEPGDRHSGCDNNDFLDRIYPLEKITNEMKESILDQINSFRSLVATGKQPPLQSASNMRLVSWNNEMEYITSRMVNAFYMFVCTKTNTFPLNTHFAKSKEINGKSISATIGLILEAKQLEYSRFYSANLTHIGCSVGKYENYSINLECITSLGDSSSIAETYLPGIPCSNCSMFNQVCSKKYPGLCEDCLEGEKCEIEILRETNAPLDGFTIENEETAISEVKESDGKMNNEIFEHSEQGGNGEVLFLAYYSSLKLKGSTIKNSLGELIGNFTKLLSSKENFSN